MRRALLLLVAALALAGCGKREVQTSPGSGAPLRVAVTGNAIEAPIDAAQRSGGFRAAGLRVTLRRAADPVAALRLLQAGDVDLAVTTAPDLVEARDRGADVVSVAALAQAPLAAFAQTKPGKFSLAAFAGKPIGTLGRDYQRAFVDRIFRDQARHPKPVNLGSNVARALADRHTVAVAGPYLDDPALIAKRARAFSVDHFGVPAYPEFVLAAHAHPDGNLTRSFMGALTRAAHGLKGSPAVKVAQRVMAPPQGRPLGYQQAIRWHELAVFLRDYRVTRTVGSEPFTNNFLPGSGP